MPSLECADAQSDKGFRCPLPETLDTIENINGEQRPGRDLARDDVNPHIVCMLEGTFSHRAALMDKLLVVPTVCHQTTP